jgi:hypothetical protein
METTDILNEIIARYDETSLNECIKTMIEVGIYDYIRASTKCGC